MGKKIIKYSKIPFLLFLGIASVLFFIFFNEFEVYSVDTWAHNKFAEGLLNLSLKEMTERNWPTQAIVYPLYHLTLKVLAVIFMGHNYNLACAVLLTICTIVSICSFRILILKIVKNSNIIEKYFIDFVSICALVFVVVRSPLTDWRYYARQCAANPVHNPTIIFLRPFGILAFLFFLLYIDRYFEKKKYGMFLFFFSLFLILGILAKPSFAFTFLPAMGIVTLISMIYQKSFRFGLITLSAVIPAIMLLLYQFIYTTNNTIALKMEIRFGSFSEFTPQEVLMVSLATFPVPIILFSIKAWKKSVSYQIAMCALMIGWFEMFFLTNGPTGDFSWGYDLAVQFATIIAIACSMKYKMIIWRRGLAYILFFYQSICGIQYLMKIFITYDMWI